VLAPKYFGDVLLKDAVFQEEKPIVILLDLK